jgi:anti-anti-sigma factor
MTSPGPSRRLACEPRGPVTAAYFKGQNIMLGEVPAKEMVEELAQLAARLASGTLVLSLGGVIYLDSSALGKLVGLHKKLKAAGGGLIVCDLAPEVYEAFAQTHLDKFLDLRPKESLESLAPRA